MAKAASGRLKALNSSNFQVKPKSLESSVNSTFKLSER